LNPWLNGELQLKFTTSLQFFTTVDVSVTVSLHEPYSSLMYTVFK